MLSVCVPTVVIAFCAGCIYHRLHSMSSGEQRSMTVLAKQMARMSLFQLVIVLVFQFPYGVATAYSVGTSTIPKTADRQIQDKLSQAFFELYVYGLYTVSNI